MGAIWEPFGGPGEPLGEPLEALEAEECSEGVGDPPPESLRGCLPRKKPLKTNGNIKILNNEEKSSEVFFNLLRPRKLASRAGEKQILRKKIRKK